MTFSAADVIVCVFGESSDDGSGAIDDWSGGCFEKMRDELLLDVPLLVSDGCVYGGLGRIESGVGLQSMSKDGLFLGDHWRNEFDQVFEELDV